MYTQTFTYIYCAKLSNLKIKNLKKGEGIDHCNKSKETRNKNYALARAMANLSS